MKNGKNGVKSVLLIVAAVAILVVGIIVCCNATSIGHKMAHAERKVLSIADDLVHNAKAQLTDLVNENGMYPNTKTVISQRGEGRKMLTLEVNGYPDFGLSMWFLDGYDAPGGEIYVPPMENVVPMSKAQQETFEKAKRLVTEYVKHSEVIAEEDKEGCIAHLNTVTVTCGDMVFEPGVPNDIAMLTSGEKFNELYVNNRMSSCMTLHTFVHELIHVVSRYTNRAMSAERGYYYLGFIPEAVTDLIAISVCQEVGETPVVTQYSQVYKPAMLLVGRFGLGFYFYEKELETVLNAWGKLKLDLFFGMANQAPAELNKYMALFLL